MTQHLAKTPRGLRFFETCTLIEIRNPLVLSDVNYEVVVVVVVVAVVVVVVADVFHVQTESWSTQKSIRPKIMVQSPAPGFVVGSHGLETPWE